MNRYYSQKLSGKRLEQCYNLATGRVRQYLKAEIDFVGKKINTNDLVLELGCGYGRIFPGLSKKTDRIIGIDNSFSSLQYGKNLFAGSNFQFLQMDAGGTGFLNNVFDVVLCIQNGISAFKVKRKKLIDEAIRITKPGGSIFFSTYSHKFWKHRLEWFKVQSQHNLLGEIDYNKTQDGVIVCKDGFEAVTILKDDFAELTSNLNMKIEITEIDNSSLFCVIQKS